MIPKILDCWDDDKIKYRLKQKESGEIILQYATDENWNVSRNINIPIRRILALKKQLEEKK